MPLRHHISRVVTPADSLALVTLDQVKTALGIDPADTTQDVALQEEIDQVSQGIDNYCDRIFARQTYRDQYRHACNWLRNGQPLRTRQAPIELDAGGVPVLTITEDGVELAAEAWEVDPDTGELFRLESGTVAGWYAGLILIDYGGGYDPIPPVVQGAALEWISVRRSSKGRDPALRSVTIPDVITRVYSDTAPTASDRSSGAAATAMPAIVRDWLEFYRRWSV